MRCRQSRWQPDQGRNPLTDSLGNVQTNRASSLEGRSRPNHRRGEARALEHHTTPSLANGAERKIYNGSGDLTESGRSSMLLRRDRLSSWVHSMRESRLIDGIAREIRRDVLYLRFGEDAECAVLESQVDEITAWLDGKEIGWDIVEWFDPKSSFVAIEGGPTCLYIDIDPTDEQRFALNGLIYYEDGSPIFRGLTLEVFKLSKAIKHAYRDDPDYWDKVV